jgi:hypothetical protein
MTNAHFAGTATASSLALSMIATCLATGTPAGTPITMGATATFSDNSGTAYQTQSHLVSVPTLARIITMTSTATFSDASGRVYSAQSTTAQTLVIPQTKPQGFFARLLMHFHHRTN